MKQSRKRAKGFLASWWKPSSNIDAHTAKFICSDRPELCDICSWTGRPWITTIHWAAANICRYLVGWVPVKQIKQQWSGLSLSVLIMILMRYYKQGCKCLFHLPMIQFANRFSPLCTAFGLYSTHCMMWHLFIGIVLNGKTWENLLSRWVFVLRSWAPYLRFEEVKIWVSCLAPWLLVLVACL